MRYTLFRKQADYAAKLPYELYRNAEYAEDEEGLNIGSTALYNAQNVADYLEAVAAGKNVIRSAYPAYKIHDNNSVPTALYLAMDSNKLTPYKEWLAKYKAAVGGDKPNITELDRLSNPLLYVVKNTDKDNRFSDVSSLSKAQLSALYSDDPRKSAVLTLARRLATIRATNGHAELDRLEREKAGLINKANISDRRRTATDAIYKKELKPLTDREDELQVLAWGGDRAAKKEIKSIRDKMALVYERMAEASKAIDSEEAAIEKSVEDKKAPYYKQYRKALEEEAALGNIRY